MQKRLSRFLINHQYAELIAPTLLSLKPLFLPSYQFHLKTLENYLGITVLLNILKHPVKFIDAASMNICRSTQ